MQSNYDYDISSGEEEGGPVSQTAAANPNDQNPKITAHHSNHSSDGVGNPLFLALGARVSPLGKRPLQNYRGSPVHGGNVRRTKGAFAG